MMRLGRMAASRGPQDQQDATNPTHASGRAPPIRLAASTLCLPLLYCIISMMIVIITTVIIMIIIESSADETPIPLSPCGC